MLTLFGIPQFQGKPVTLERALYLVALLVCHQKPMPRDELMLLLWADDGDESAIKQRLRQLAYRTKQLPYGAGLESGTQFFSYSADSDVAQFRAAILQHNHAQALELYKGDLLHGAVFEHSELEEWFLLERETLRASYIQAALSHAATLPKPEAAKLLEHAMQHDPDNEDLLRALLEYAKTAPEVGKRVFERYSRHLAQDLGLEPPPDVQHLVASLGAAPAIRPMPRSRLPIPSSQFIGRQAELEDIERLLVQTRLLSLVGVGGVGKTRLSLEVASRSQRHASFVDLARLNSPELVPNAILEALGESAHPEPLEQLHRLLADRPMLLLFDNFEHVMPAREVVSALLAQHPELQVLVTSRERLGLQQEQVYELTGLPAPDTVFPLESQDAALVFLRAAQRSQLDFSLRGDIENFSRIYHAVSGMPLGLELSASWVRTLSLQEIAEELEQSLDVLAVDAPDMPERHRSFAAVFTSSWQLLTPQEQTTLAQLSIFQGGFDKDMAAQVCKAPLTVLLKLVNKSLVTRREQRFVLHELVRQYSQPHLQDPNPTFLRLAETMLALSQEWQQHKKGERQTELSKRLETDHDNIRAALNWSLAHQPKIGAAITGNLEHFWYLRGHHREGATWAAQFLEQYQASDLVKLHLLWTQASLTKELSDYATAKQITKEYQALAQTLDAKQALAGAEKFIGLLEREQGNVEAGKIHLQRAKTMYEALDDVYGTAICVNDLGIVHAMQGDLETAKMCFEESLHLKRQVGDKMGVAYAIGNLGVIAGQQGDLALERVLHEESLHLKRELGDKQGIGNGLQSLGSNALEQNQIELALDYFAQSLQIFTELGRRYTQSNLLFDFAKCAWKLGDAHIALELNAAAIHWRYAIRSQPAKNWLEQQKEWQQESRISPAELAKLEFDVQKLKLEEVVSKALRWRTTVSLQAEDSYLV